MSGLHSTVERASSPIAIAVPVFEALETRLFLSGSPLPPAVPLATTGSVDTLLIRAVFRGDTVPAPEAERFRAAFERAADALADASGDRLRLQPLTVTPVVTLPGSRDSYATGSGGFERLRVDAIAAARGLGYAVDAFWNDIVWFPETRFPGGVFESFGGLGNDGTRGTWLNGTLEGDVILHELGHNLGLDHAAALDGFGPAEPAPIDGRVVVYGDPYDVMGRGSAETGFNAAARAALGWLPTRNIAVPAGDVRFKLYDLDADAAPTRAVALSGTEARLGTDPLAAAPDRTWLEYRPGLAGPAGTGLRVYRGPSAGGDGRGLSRLLDPLPDSRPGDADFLDAALPVGQTLVDPLTGVAIRVEDTGSDNRGAFLQIRLDFDTALSIGPDRFEDNDRREAAAAFAGASLQATATDVDWYRLSAGPGALTLSLDHDADAGDLDFELYTADGRLLNGSYGADDRESFTTTLASGGDYLVFVYSDGGNPRGNVYDLTRA